MPMTGMDFFVLQKLLFITKRTYGVVPGGNCKKGTIINN